MTVLVEIPVGTAAVLVAAIPLWWNIYTRKITEKNKDLESGEPNRVEYVIRQMPNLEPKLKAAVGSVKNLDIKAWH